MTQDLPPAETIAFLRAQAAGTTAPSGAAPSQGVSIIETHGALVFVGPQTTLKIKRPVKFSYMDFSTLEKRRAAITREYEINRVHAPEIYLGVMPVRKSADGALHLSAQGDDGQIEDWVLQMRTFPQADVLSNRLRSGPLPEAVTKSIAIMVADYHASAPQAENANSIAQMRAVIDDLARAFGEANATLSPDVVRAWQTAADRALASCSGILSTRASAGFVRRCHGDLHSNNVVIWKDKPTAFDAIEFDERIATIDTLYDLAFLLMDLDERGHRAEANLLLAHYLWRTRNTSDLDGLRALPLFLSLRAGIRAMVALQHARNASNYDEASRNNGASREIADACAYFSYARSVLKDAAPQLIAVGGLSGTGKSTLAKKLAPKIGRAPGAIHLRSDLERKAMFGVGETERLEARHYTGDVSERVYARLMERARHVLDTGHSVVVDAVFSTQDERAAVENIAQDLGLAFVGLWLSAPLEILQRRVSERSGDASDATAEVVAVQFEREPGPLTWHEIDASRSPEDAVAQSQIELEQRAAPSARGPGRK